jgi:peptidyl-prolyl cis-trans isomerase SurA
VRKSLQYIGIAVATFFLLAPLPLLAQAQPQTGAKGKVVEEIIARVNNDIITLSDFEKAKGTLAQETAQDCQGCPQDRLDAMFKDRQKDLLRDLIDQSLLVQRAKDMGMSVEAEVIKRLDEVRVANHLASMEDLEKAVESQGIAWEEYKSSIRNNLLTREVIQREVGGHINVGSGDVKKYYEEHQQEFNRPEQVLLQEILLSTEGKTPDEIAAIEKKAKDIRARIAKGEDFTELARRLSEGQTAKQGGDLGSFERGMLAKEIEDIVFKMNRGDVTEVIQAKTGFEILKVIQHYQAGVQPLEKVEGEITNKLAMERMQPNLREYLAHLREESYVLVKPGYVDSAAVSSNSAIEEVAPTPDTPGKKSKKAKGSSK